MLHSSVPEKSLCADREKPRLSWTEQERIEALRAYDIIDTLPETAFDDIAGIAARTCGTPIAVINFIDRDRQWFKAEIGLGMREAPVDGSICRHAILQKGLFVVPDTLADPRFACNPPVIAGSTLRFYAGVLLETPAGIPLGTICVLDVEPRPDGLTSGQAETLAALARAAMNQLELRLANKVIGESERRFRVLADTMPQMIWSTLPNGSHDYFNERWYEFTGAPKGSTDGDGWKDLFHPDDQERAAEIWGRSLATGEPYEINYRLRHHSGEYRWTLGRAMPIRNAAGEIERWFGTCTDIHEAEVTKAALAESETRYRALVEATAMIVWRASPDGAILDGWGWDILTGQSAEEYRGNGWLDVIHPEDRDGVIALWEGLLAASETKTLEYRVRLVDGSYRWVQANAVPMVDAHGKTHEWLGTVSDIHESKMSEAVLRASEERYRALVEASSTVGWRATPDGAIIEISGWQDGAVQDDESMLGHQWLDAVHPDDRDVAAARWNQALVTEYNLHNEYRIFHHGEYQWVRATAVPLRSPDGTIREWVGTITNIHDQVMAERALSASEERYRLVARATTDAIWDWDLVEGTIAWGESAATLLGYESQEIGASSEWWLGKIHPLDRERIERSLRESFTGADERWLVEYRFQRGDGSYAEVLDCGYLIRDENNCPIRMVGALQDISERQKAQEAVRASEERLRLALHAGRMVAWERNADSDFISRSDNAPEMLGIESGTLSDFLEQVHPEDRDKLPLFVKGALRDGPRTTEVRYSVPGGREIWLGMRAEMPSQDRVIGIAFDITDRKLAEAEIWRIANHDPLTGLPNRALFQNRLEEALANAEADGTSVSLLMIDLDDFKDVNDSLGHDAGDALLKETAERLKAMSSENDLVARVGGDEFAMILVAPIGLDEATGFAELVVENLRKVFSYQGRVLTTKASIGLAAYPEHHRHPAELMKDADIALYRAKAEGRNRASVYTETARKVTERRLQILREVRAGLEADQFIPHYQPKVCLSTGRIIGFEALARWKHPSEGLRTPGYFGEAFADAEIAVALGKTIIRNVVSDIRAWLNKGLEFGHVAVNFSSAEFYDPFLAKHVLQFLEQGGVPANRLEVEVTETVLLGRSSETVLEILSHFHENGVKIALDDFGTGYASLSHLKQFPVDHIKIDQSFVRDLVSNKGDDAIVAAVIGLGENLGMEITAEGVETHDQADQLRKMGCDFAQGYLFAKPMAASRVPWLIRNWPGRSTKLADAS